MSPIFFFRITLFFYFLGCTLFLLNLWDRRSIHPTDPNAPDVGLDPSMYVVSSPLLPVSQKLAFLATGIGFLCHTAALLIRIQAEVPFSNLKEAISFFSWAIVLVFFLVELRYRVYVMGSFILPLAFLSLISAAALPYNTPTIVPTLKGALLGLHTTLSLLGIVAFAIAAIVGIMYLLQERFLKSKQLNALYDKLPSLSLLDQWNRVALLCGFPLLTLGMITGALWSQYALGSFWSSNNPKQVLSIGAWFFYFILLHGRITVGWRARRTARLAIIGFVGVIFIFVTLM